MEVVFRGTMVQAGEGGYPTHPIAPGGGPSQGPGFPTPPIYYPPFGEGGEPSHPITIPSPGPGHPIYIPPGSINRPTLPIFNPAEPTHPITGLGDPAHPIHLPPTVWPGPGAPTHPIAPGGPPPVVNPGPGTPTHPIAPGGAPGTPTQPIAGYVLVWNPTFGWCYCALGALTPAPVPAHPIAPGGPAAQPK